MEATDIKARAALLGLTVNRTSPGDGATRYEFRIATSAYGHRTLGTAVGRREAAVWLNGFEEGIRYHDIARSNANDALTAAARIGDDATLAR